MTQDIKHVLATVDELKRICEGSIVEDIGHRDEMDWVGVL